MNNHAGVGRILHWMPGALGLALLAIPMSVLYSEELTHPTDTHNAWDLSVLEKCTTNALGTPSPSDVRKAFADAAIAGKISEREPCLANAATSVAYEKQSPLPAGPFFRRLLELYPQNSQNWADAFESTIRGGAEAIDLLGKEQPSFAASAIEHLGVRTASNARGHAALCLWLMQKEASLSLRANCWPGDWIVDVYPSVGDCLVVRNNLHRALVLSLKPTEIVDDALNHTTCGETSVNLYHQALYSVFVSKDGVLAVRDRAARDQRSEEWYARFPADALLVYWFEDNCPALLNVAKKNEAQICGSDPNFLGCERAMTCAKRSNDTQLQDELKGIAVLSKRDQH